ncbi:hypothetical protein MAPG_08281 [Magnaporthiopsis poae ATCC 64411]|uniref:Uncharacterized protein n=1 Tax=Magnaporthiopsis poae (strain ATCC 64411 / 73-15) TaxID=644358 RepID=A0A0C4E6Y1_MAGP6|nr:hypothetical protein MAPG_08281 [Magnaporthiopsis poae ATCC 64411]
MRVLQFWTWLTKLKVAVRPDQQIVSQDGRERRDVPEERTSAKSCLPKPAELREQGGDASHYESGDGNDDDDDDGGDTVRVNGKAAGEKEKEEAEDGNSVDAAADDDDDNDDDDDYDDGTSSTFSTNSSDSIHNKTDDSSKEGGGARHHKAVVSSRPLRRCDIFDDAGDWCGTIMLPERWARARSAVTRVFIAVSDAKSLTEEECPVWNYYVPRERGESEWDLYYVMLLERTADRSMWERRGLGKVFKPAFKDATWSEIKLG